MSTVLVVAPIVIGNWPLIAAAVTTAVASLGFALASDLEQSQTQTARGKTRAEIEVPDSEILQEAAGADQAIVVQRDGVRATFSRDARGALRVCMEGHGLSKAELQRIGQELIDRVTQQYVYHRLMTELNERGMTVVDEQVAEDRTVKIRVRNW
jgi:alpha-tubulin suppressor-like RCC1 family protein